MLFEREYFCGKESDMQRTDIASLEKAIGYTFKNKDLLVEAVTHSSYAHELKAKKIDVRCNERLEFLGDSVLSLVTSEYLFSRFGELPEGDLTHIRAALVQSQALAGYARAVGLGEYLYLGNGEDFTGKITSIRIDLGASVNKTIKITSIQAYKI